MLLKIFNFKKNTSCKKGDFFAILKGKYAGEFWVLINDNEKEFNFLSLPNLKKRSAPKEKIDIGINLKIMDYIQNIPNKVFKVCEKQYKNIVV
jgi:hypothetical protein